jgi:hypothetical protein
MGARGAFAALSPQSGAALGCQSMIPKSGNRFSEKIMLKQKAKA